MDEKRVELLNLENRFLQNRRALNDLIYAQGAGTQEDAVVQEKIRFLQTELDYMAKQLELLKRSAGQPTAATAASVTTDAVKTATDADSVATAATASQSAERRQSAGQPTVRPTELKPSAERLEKPAHTTSIESLVGKSWMGVLASVLIFISLILFATLIIPVMTDTMKLIAMYVVSFAFTFVGYYLVHKWKYPVYLAIAGCGVGLVYLSLFMSYIYFGVYDEVTLYVLVLFWAIAVCLLGKFQSRVFEVIGQVGILISVLFGCVLCAGESDGLKFLVLLIFYLVASTVFLVAGFQRDYKKNLMHHIFAAIDILILTVAYSCMGDGKSLAGCMLLMLIILVQLGLAVVLDLPSQFGGYGVFVSLHVFFLSSLIFDICNQYDLVSWLPGAFCALVGVCMIVLLEWKCKETGFDRIVLQISAFALLLISVAETDIFSAHFGYAPIAVAFLLLGIRKNDALYKYGSIVALVCIWALDIPIWEAVLTALIYFGIAAWLLFARRDQYRLDIKLAFYSAFQLNLWWLLVEIGHACFLEEELIFAAVFIPMALVHVISMKTLLPLDLSTAKKEDTGEWFAYIVNLLFMFVGTCALKRDYEIGLHLLLMLTSIILFSANAKNLLQREKKERWGVYVGIKFTFLLIVILQSFDAASAIISILVFLLAIVCIAVGFVIRIPSVRIYGLVVSIVSVIKLVMVDIQAENTVGHAVSFFVCGLLCFAISMIYTFVEKKMK